MTIYHSDNSSVDNRTISSLRKGKKWAFKAIFNYYHLKLYYFTKKMGLMHEDSENLVQEVFLTLWEKRTEIKEEYNFQSYLYTITKRLTIKELRKQALEKQFQIYSKGFLNEVSDHAEEAIIFSDLLNEAYQSIDKLPSERKEIFLLSKEKGLSNQEIADKLHISKRTVENQLYRATKTIREQINPQNA